MRAILKDVKVSNKGVTINLTEGLLSPEVVALLNSVDQLVEVTITPVEPVDLGE